MAFKATRNMPFIFVAVILKVLLVNLLAALNFANVFFLKKKRLENKKNVKNVFTSMVRPAWRKLVGWTAGR